MAFHPCNVASSELTKKIRAVEPSKGCGQLIYPCAIVLRDGRRIERVACIEEPHGLYNKEWIPLEEIDQVEESPFRLPASYANQVYEAGEAGMGYCLFTVKLADGKDFVCITGSALVDFPGLPPGITSKEIVGVLPNVGCERTILPAPDHSWCYFVGTD